MPDLRMAEYALMWDKCQEKEVFIETMGKQDVRHVSHIFYYMVFKRKCP